MPRAAARRRPTRPSLPAMRPMHSRAALVLGLPAHLKHLEYRTRRHVRHMHISRKAGGSLSDAAAAEK